MKKTIFIFLLSLLIKVNYAQTINAGQTGSGVYYHDINPDTTLQGNKWVNNPVILPIDMNGDSIVDFELIVYVYNCGMACNHCHSYILPIDSNQVAFGYVDSCKTIYTPPGFIETDTMIHLFNYNDAINSSASWTNSSVNFAFRYWGQDRIDCGDNAYTSGSVKYIGVRVYTSTSILYGWIKISGITNSSFTIEEFGCATH